MKYRVSFVCNESVHGWGQKYDKNEVWGFEATSIGVAVFLAEKAMPGNWRISAIEESDEN